MTKKRIGGVHWVYVPDKQINFYRLGFYDNILNSEKGSVYIEIGFDKDANIDIEKEYTDTINGLRQMGVIDIQKIADYQALVMDPAYVHIQDIDSVAAVRQKLRKKDIYLLGRYGYWTYCSIEDCVKAAVRLKEEIG